MTFDDDLALQLQLQEQVMSKRPSIMDLPDDSPTHQWQSKIGNENKDPNKKQTSLIDPSFEYIDPTPDVHAMFLQFNSRFFGGKLYSVEVRWSPRMTSCAGMCCYEGRGGLCSVRLSVPLLKLRPRKDLVETLLHEMIHAYLFVTNNDRDRDGHGPEFHKHMYRINKEAGTNISVYHDFHDEVRLYQQHWWRCNGPCQKWRPYFGMVKRAMNRPPGPTDFWWANHQAKCGGTYTKVREPEGFSKKKTSRAPMKGIATSSNERNDIRNFFPFMGEGKVLSTSESNGKANNVLDSKYSSENGNLRNTDILNSKKLKPCGSAYPTSVTTSSSTKHSPVNKETNVGIKAFFDKPVSTDNTKRVSDSHKNCPSSEKSSLPAGSSSGSKFGKTGRGGILANKGSGTIVITQKGNQQTQKNSNSASGPLTHRSVSTAVTPFVGKGYTIGSSRSSQPVPAPVEKPWLSLLDRLEADSEKKKQLSSLATREASSTGQVIKINKVIHSDSRMENPNGSVQSPPKKFKKSPVEKPFYSGNGHHDKSGSNINDKAQSLLNDGLEFMINCPTCGTLVKESLINSHLDICVQNDLKEDSQNVANCPICCKDFPLIEIYCHVDACLSSNDDSMPVTPEVVDGDIIKCPMCDEKLLKSSLGVHLESCIHCVTKTDPCFIENCDNDFNDATASTSVCGEELHPCPVCMKLVKENLMNHHLDECLSADILKKIVHE